MSTFQKKNLQDIPIGKHKPTEFKETEQTFGPESKMSAMIGWGILNVRCKWSEQDKGATLMESVHVMPRSSFDPFIFSICPAPSIYAILPPMGYTCHSTVTYCPQATRATFYQYRKLEVSVIYILTNTTPTPFLCIQSFTGDRRCVRMTAQLSCLDSGRLHSIVPLQHQAKLPSINWPLLGLSALLFTLPPFLSWFLQRAFSKHKNLCPRVFLWETQPKTFYCKLSQHLVLSTQFMDNYCSKSIFPSSVSTA